MSSHSRQKGREAEREVARIFTEAGFPCIRSEANGAGGEDIQHHIPGLWFEVKRQERLNLREAYKQARKASGKRHPVVVHRSNREEWLVSFSLSHFLTILKVALRYKSDIV